MEAHPEKVLYRLGLEQEDIVDYCKEVISMLEATDSIYKTIMFYSEYVEKTHHKKFINFIVANAVAFIMQSVLENSTKQQTKRRQK